jgi:hypothetical protein
LASGDGSPQTLQTGSYSIGDPRVVGIDYLEPSATTGQIGNGNGKGIGSGWNDPQNLQTTFPRNDFSTGQYTIGTPQGNYTPTNNFSWSNVPIGGFGNRGPSPTGDPPSPVMRAPQKDRRSAAPDGTPWTSAQGAAPDTPAFQRDAAYSPTGDFYRNFPRMSAVAAAPSPRASNGSGPGSGPRITDALNTAGKRAVPVLTRVGKFIGDSLITPRGSFAIGAAVARPNRAEFARRRNARDRQQQASAAAGPEDRQSLGRRSRRYTVFARATAAGITGASFPYGRLSSILGSAERQQTASNHV